MQLELKHAAPYLPCDLKWKFEGEDIVHSLVGLDITDKGIKLISPYNDYGSCDIQTGKPILRLLSDLTKEIEHNGDKIVPIIELLKIKHPPPEGHKSRYGLIEICSSGYPNAYYRFRANYEIMVNTNDLDNTPYWIIKKLIEWKFDVFGLIDAGLAISVHDLPENPYN